MNEKLNYAGAIEELERIVGEIESETVSVDELTAKVKRAMYLIKFCRTRLKKTEDEVKKVLSETDEKDQNKATAEE